MRRASRDNSTIRHSDRCSYRVATADHPVFELDHDAISDAWVLDIVHD